MTDLAAVTTIGVGGPAREFLDVDSEADFIAAVREADESDVPLLVLGGGSNMVIADAGFDGRVVRDRRSDVTVQDDGFCGGVSVTVAAGAPWDPLVARAVAEGWVGMEALSGIPGSTGATPVQNVGAYGAEVSDITASVRTWDRHDRAIRSLMHIQCGFSYRDSLLKRTMRGEGSDGRTWWPTPRFVVLDVTFQMRFGTRSAPVRYQQLADALEIELGESAPTDAVRAAVLELRASKGMVIDPEDPDTRSVGSFFVNPVLSAAAAAALPVEAPRFPANAGSVKTSAAWLIENAGFERGFGLTPNAAARLSSKHTLAITNRGGASAADVLELARAVRAGVAERFGVELATEPMLVGLEL